MRKFIGLKTACAALALLAATAITLPAQTFTSLLSFDGTDGANPYAALVQATDGNLYGTTFTGGANGGGTVFRITPSGALMTLYSFCSQSGCTDGVVPWGGLLQATDGNFYGTTYSGGANGYGTVFKITASGTLTTVYSFCSKAGCADGELPYAPLLQATNGNFYGTTASGGANGYGTVFEITPSGTLTTLYSFCSQSGCTDGSNPLARLVQATNGNFYGTTYFGGANGYNYGTVFKITPSGTLTTLYSFCSLTNCTDGANSFAGLVQATNGDFYGTTSNGPHGYNYGTVFKITPSGTLTTLYSFCSLTNCTDGANPYAGLVQATNGDFYGTTSSGADGGGTVFKITASGTLTTLYSFCSQSGCTDGNEPLATLVQDTNGSFYGTTWLGGASDACASGCGTVFSLSVGLAPFLETQPTLGPVGMPVKILGTNLTGATSVTFNGTPAVFTVFSSSLIGAKVPAGATTGTVQVVTPSGTFSSNVPFRVRH